MTATIKNFSDELIVRYIDENTAEIQELKPPFLLTHSKDGIVIDDSTSFDLPEGEYKMIFDSSYFNMAVIRQVDNFIYYAIPMIYPSPVFYLHINLRHGDFPTTEHQTDRYNCNVFYVAKDANNEPIFKV